MAMRTAAGLWACGLCLACDPSPGGGSTTTDGTTTGSATGTPPTTGPAPTTGTTSEGADSSGTTAADDATDGTTTSTSGVDSTGPGSSSSGSPDDGLGMLSGRCGLIDAMELNSPSPFDFENAIDFGREGFDYDQLTPEGQQVFDAGNLGGSSLHSEVISFEVLARCDGATLLETEGTIEYLDDMGTKTDLLVEIDGLPVGVSVTRAVGFPQDDPYTVMQGEAILVDKLGDILMSSANVAPSHQWVKQILHVIAYADMHAESVLSAYAQLAPELTADTVLLVTVTHGDDAFVY